MKKRARKTGGREPRVHVPDLPADGTVFEVDAAEREHLVKVLRLAAGDPFVAFDGAGRAARCAVESVERRRVVARVESALPAASGQEPPHAIELLVAAPRASRQENLVRAITELGATRIVPLACERARTPTREATGLQERWRRYAIEAAKQCWRDRLPVVEPPLDLAAALEQGGSPVRRVLLQPEAPGLESVLGAQPPGAIRLLVGPEGGFTASELDLARHSGVERAGLGAIALRIETAACAALALVAAWMRQASPQK